MWTVIIAGVKLVSTTVFPNQASNNIKKKAPNANRGILLSVFLNLKAPWIRNRNTKPAKTETSLLMYSVQVWNLLNLL